MAFATRSLRVLCKLYNGSVGGSYSLFKRPVARISVVQAAQRYYCNIHSASRPKIADNLTNIQSSITSTSTFAHETSHHRAPTNEKEDEEDKQSREFSRKVTQNTFRFFGVVLVVGSMVLVYLYGEPRYDEHGNLIEDEFSHMSYAGQRIKRVLRQVMYWRKVVQEPSRSKLLPDPLKYPYIQPPYTIVLEMTDLLVHPDWTYQTGWRFKKRPGVDQFLEAIAPPQFEIVVYTAEQGATVFPILDALDPRGYIMYRLVRDATRFIDGHHVKDLDVLNRDLSKVIAIDWNDDSVKYHPENTLRLPRWTGNDNDTTLYDLAAFLKTILATKVEDVRDVISYYRQFDNPLEAFRENQRKLMIQMQEEEESKARTNSNKVLTSKWKPSFLRQN